MEWWQLTRAVRRWRPIGVAARAALLFAVAWWLAVWILRRQGWQHGVNLRELLGGPLGHYLFPAVTYIQSFFLRPGAHALRSTVDAIISFFPWHSLLSLELWVILVSMGLGILSVRTYPDRAPKPIAVKLQLRRIASSAAWAAATPVFIFFLLAMLSLFLLISSPPNQVPQLLHDEPKFLTTLLHMQSAWALLLLVILWELADIGLSFSAPLDVSGSVSPGEALRLDRQATLLYVFMKRASRAIVLWLFFAPVIALAYGLYAVANLLCRIVLGAVGTASECFSDARIWLACTRRMPWRTMAFLIDAHQLAVLRQAGAVYEFRHIRLQQQLSASHRRWSQIMASAAVRYPRLRKFLDRGTRWRLWSWSTAPGTEPIWDLRFRKAARALHERVGQPTEDVHHEEPGIVQAFDGVSGDDAWVVCALPYSEPTLVAKPVWEALRQAGARTPSGAMTQLGFPVGDKREREFGYRLRDRIVPADATRVELLKGSWGTGLLLRDDKRETWRWQPEESFGSVPISGEWPWMRLPPPQLRVRATAAIPCALSGLLITSQAHQELAAKLTESDLARALTALSARRGTELRAGHWQDCQVGHPLHQGRCFTCVIAAPDGRCALAAEVKLSLSDVTGCTTVTAIAEVRIQDLAAWRDALNHAGKSHTGEFDGSRLRLSLGELADIFSAAWHSVAELLPAAILGDVDAVPPAGPPLVDLLLSATTPVDLLFERLSLMTLRDLRRLARLLLGKGGKHRRGDLRGFVNFSPFVRNGSHPRLTEMSVRITGPLQLSTGERQQRTRQALSWMLRNAGLARPAGAVRTGEADPRKLGVHAAISVPGVPNEVLPEYVPRDVDTAEYGVQAKVTAAAEQGGFVLLIGGSSVGKTRCAVETVRTLPPDWWLVHPVGPDEVAALAAWPTPETVVWLDELQRYLDGEHGLTSGVVRALLNAPHPAVIIGTLWPDRYTAYTTVPAPGAADPHARERQVLDLAAVVRIDPAFSPAEQVRARDAAARDPRLKIALDAAAQDRAGAAVARDPRPKIGLEADQYRLTQALAAAPQLVARWQDAQTASPYAWAVLTAALDAARLGARAPLRADFLRTAAPGYCIGQQRQTEPPDNWFEQALAYGTAKLHGAAAALSPARADMGQVAGYTAADYLVQLARWERRYERVPASTWEAILSHISDPADTARLAHSARNRLLYRYATPLYRHAAEAGDGTAALRLAELLTERGDLNEAAQIHDRAVRILRAQAEAGDGAAASRLAELLTERGDLNEAAQIHDRAVRILRAQAEAGDGAAASRLAELLTERGDLNDAAQIHDRAVRILRAQAEAGDGAAASRLAELLTERGDLDGLRARVDAGDGAAASRLPGLLTKQGRGEEAEQLRRYGLNPDGSIAYA